MSEYLCNKELADKMRLSVRSLRDWKKRLRLKPTVNHHSGQRWSQRDADRFVKAWAAYPKKKRKRR